jgi:hypothetical protein
LTVVSADLNSDDLAPYRGSVDVIDSTHGVQGWVVNLAAPRKPPVVALKIGSKLVARATPNRERAEISQALNQRVMASFTFDAKQLRFPAQADDPIEIVIAGTEFTLGCAGRDFRVRDLGLKIVSARVSEAHGASASVDRLLVVPGFGCLVEGWLLSPLKRVAGLRLRIGGVVLVARADAIWRRARPDLLEAFPDSEGLTEEAGFVAWFAGADEPADASGAALEVAFDGGAVGHFAISPGVPRLLGHSAGVSDALAFFPSLANEPFFGSFAIAAAAAERKGLARLASLRLTTMPRALIHVLPEERSDVFLLFEKLAAACRDKMFGGVTFIAAKNGNRADAPWHFDDLLGSFPVPASLIAVGRARDAFHLLLDILGMIGAERFVFAASGMFPTPEGYRLAAEYLRAPAKSAGSGAMFLGVEGDANFPSSRCFGWTTKSLLAWWHTAPVFIGGHYRDNLLARGGSPALHAGVVAAGRPAGGVPIEEAINRVLYDAAMR